MGSKGLRVWMPVALVGALIFGILASSAAMGIKAAHAAGTGQYSAPEWFPLRRAAGGAEVKNGCTYLSPYAPENICNDGNTPYYHTWWALDLMVANGSPVYAAGAGQVSLHPLPNTSGYGNYIIVNHGSFGSTLYGHLSAFSVSNGAWVDQNTQIGSSGDSGASGVYHLHFEKINPGGSWGHGGSSVDPGPLKACHGSTQVTYPQAWGVTTWKGMHWGAHTGYSDGTSCSGGQPSSTKLLLAVIDSAGTTFVKEGSLGAPWVGETGLNARAVSVATDPVNGPLIGVIDSAGTTFVKEGSLSAPYVGETGTNARAVSVASDSVRGPLIGVIDSNGQTFVKQGSLGAPWVGETGLNARAVSVATDPVNGPLIAVIDSAGTTFVKEGSLGAPWVGETGINARAVSVASDPTNGPLISVIDSNGTTFAKVGSLSAPWVAETGPGARALSNAHAISVPTAPGGVHSAVAADVASVSWSAPSDGGLPITGYTVTAFAGGKTATVVGATLHATFSHLSAGSYKFRVRANNAVGSGPWSAWSNTVTVATPQTTQGGQGSSGNAAKSGYWMLGADGHVYAFGASAYGNARRAAVAIAPRRDGKGYWVTDALGVVSHFGTAGAHGGGPALRAGELVSTISATPSGNGYWLFTNRGRAFAYGDAHFYGDMSATVLNGPVVASVATPTGHGYFMVGSDGGVFSFGDAHFHGSTGAMHLNKPIVGISPTPDNRGYWLVASDGGVFAFSAPFRGSMGATTLSKPVNGLVAYGNGYLMVASDGGVFDFSNKAFLGSLANHPPSAPIIGIAAYSS